jgi:hypothetical protein
VIVKIPDANEAQTLSAATNQEIVAKIRRDAPGEISKDVLPDGRIKVQTATHEAAKKLQYETGWAREITLSAKISQKVFPVITHGLNRKELGEDTGAIADRLTRENKRPHPEMQIQRARWLHKELSKGKVRMYLPSCIITVVRKYELTGVSSDAGPVIFLLRSAIFSSLAW